MRFGGLDEERNAPRRQLFTETLKMLLVFDGKKTLLNGLQSKLFKVIKCKPDWIFFMHHKTYFSCRRQQDGIWSFFLNHKSDQIITSVDQLWILVNMAPAKMKTNHNLTVQHVFLFICARKNHQKNQILTTTNYMEDICKLMGCCWTQIGFRLCGLLSHRKLIILFWAVNISTATISAISAGFRGLYDCRTD